MDLQKLNINDLLSYYNASELVFDHYDNQAKANELNDQPTYIDSKSKRDDMFRLNRRILAEIEKRLGVIS